MNAIKTLKLAALLGVVLVFGTGSSCSKTQQGAGIGAATGAAAGGLIGSTSGNAGTGALIGAGAGGVGGALIGEQMEKNDHRHRRGY